MKRTKWPSAILFVLLFADTGLSCVCTTPDVKVAFKRANVVFAGEVISIRKGRARFKVTQAWKGVSGSEVTLIMGGAILRRNKKHYEVAAHTSCDIEFEKGERYLVYGSDSGGYVRAWTCSRTARLAYAQDDLKELRELRPLRVNRNRS